ncbi:MAG: M14 family zinc carboxypeptidase [Bacteroidales bacterium]
MNILFSSFLFSQVRFSSAFESGSLGEVKLIDSNWISVSSKDSILVLSYDISSRFDPLNPVDTSLPPSARWYFFKMEGTKGKMIFLNIHNSEAIRPFYSYDGVYFQRFEPGENASKGFINKIFARDTVYISHFIPYTYSHLTNKIDQWNRCEFVKYEEIGRSQMNVPIHMLTITDSSVPDKNKKRIWIHGRAHPSEQPGSWHLESMIDELTSCSEYSKTLLKQAVFYIVPFINPDGVIGGYSRSTPTGVNVEINWDRNDSLTAPEVKALKKKLVELTSEKPIDLFLNMHSQIANSVTYWIHTAESTSDRSFRNLLLFSNLTVNDNPYYTSKDQSFSDVAPRYAEGWMWNRFGDRTIAVTFETPYTYYSENKDGEWVSIENLAKIGNNSLKAISDYLDISTPCRILADPRLVTRNRWEKQTANNSVFFGDDYYKSTRNRAGIKITVPYLKKGNYKIYSWSVGAAEKTSPAGTNLWKEIGSLKHKRDGKVIWRTKAYQVGESVDKILLVK